MCKAPDCQAGNSSRRSKWHLRTWHRVKNYGRLPARRSETLPETAEGKLAAGAARGHLKGRRHGLFEGWRGSWLLMASENSELTRRRGRWISTRRRRGRSSSSHASHRKSRWRFFRRGLQLARRWRRAAIPDSAWPVLFEEAARDFELKSLRGNRWVLEKPQTRHCAPTSLAREKKPARAEELLSNSECHVAGSKPCPQATRPRASSNRS